MSFDEKNTDIETRKIEHLNLCSFDDVDFRKTTTLLEEVQLIHQSLPELDYAGVDITTTLVGKKLQAPFIIASMTGGHPKAGEINMALAKVAQARGYGFGVGSQRAMQSNPDHSWTYQVRDKAPTIPLFANLGVVQANQMTTKQVYELVQSIGADALCLHMNPAMELIQAKGDRDFRGALSTFERLIQELPVPIIGKETGSGISIETARKLKSKGLAICDASGAGGTSWIGVETMRANLEKKQIGSLLWDWGIPTAASVCNIAHVKMIPIATGGIRNGYDVARAIALGAHACGFAATVLRVFKQGGETALEEYFIQMEEELKTILVLTGSHNLKALQQAPRIVEPRLERWKRLLDVS